jgi:3-hydroxybutyryl-CoA dehydrogenase
MAKENVLVIGGGTMGQGIALACALNGYGVTIVDLPAILPRIRSGVERFLADRVKKGKLTEASQKELLSSIHIEESYAAAASADWIIEAIIESLEPKKRLFTELEALKKPEALLCSNTSSLGITNMAAGLKSPTAVLPLVEIVRTVWSEPKTLERADAFVKSLGKVPILVKDTPGFVVNRVARSFPVEALKLATEGIATPRQIDRIMRLGGGFKMGPFELMDLVGIDINFAVTQSIFRAFFEEPRFRPLLMQQELVNAGLLGRKTGQGVYRYDKDGSSVVAVEAAGVTDELRSRLVPPEVARWEPARALRDGALDARAKLILLCADAPAEVQKQYLAALAKAGERHTVVGLWAPRLSTTELAASYAWPSQVVGFGYLAETPKPATVVEVAPGLATAPEATALVEAYFQARGLETERVGDFSALVLRRVLFMIVNEAAFALWEGVASGEDIDKGMKLGTNYPAGPLEWADAIGLDRVYNGLKSLHEEYGEDRYRPCPLLRKLVAAGRTGKRAGAGFFEYGGRKA